MSGEWKAYYPDDGHDASDARVVTPQSWQHRIYEAQDAAQYACEQDYSDRDGWERIEQDFPIVIIDPDGNETRWIARHEPTISHNVEADDEA